jgi:predicted transcriptional regulator/adenylate kinase
MDENTVLMSLHPKHALKIVSGEKRLEFRRIWAKRPVSRVVIYATAPIQRIVAVATVKAVHSGSPTRLWFLCQTLGGGLTRRELYAYFRGKKTGYAVEIEGVALFEPALDPKLVIESFTPPQSLQYLSPPVFEKIEAKATQEKGRVFFVAGVHGVGKTTLCSSIACETGLIHKSAGQLIREADADALSGATKAVRHPERNQRLLIDQVAKIVRSGASLLLDGHLTLLKPDGSIEALSANIFQDLGVEGMLLLTEEVDLISERLKSRDGTDISLDGIRHHQEKEITAARNVTAALEVKLHHSHGATDKQREIVAAVLEDWRMGKACSLANSGPTKKAAIEVEI